MIMYLWLLVLMVKVYYIIDEYVSKESTTSELAARIQEKLDEWNIDTIYIDSAAQQLKADFAYDYDIYCENAVKSVNDGINYLTSFNRTK